MIKAGKRLLKQTPVYPLLRSIYRKIRNAPRHRLQRLKTKRGYAFKKLGAEYDRRIFVDNANLNGCTIISAGLGEDGSFDVGFAKQYNAKVIIVDPTPVAIEHFNKIKKHIGNLKSKRRADPIGFLVDVIQRAVPRRDRLQQKLQCLLQSFGSDLAGSAAGWLAVRRRSRSAKP